MEEIQERVVFSESTIVEEDIALKSANGSNDDSNIVESTKAVAKSLSSVEKSEDKNSESEFENDVSNIETKIPNEDARITETDDSSLKVSIKENKIVFFEPNSKQEFSLEPNASDENTNTTPVLKPSDNAASEIMSEVHTTNSESIKREFLALESKTPNEKTKNTKAIETDENVSPISEDWNIKCNFSKPKEQKENTERSNEGLTKAELSSEKSGNNSGARYTISHDDEFSDSDNDEEARQSEFGEISMVSLLRSTIGELERALRDSRALIKTRDEDIVSLRREVEKGREQIHKEQLKWQRKCAVIEERGREIQELKKKLLDSEKTVEELSERIKEFESPCSESDDIVACCSSMKELLEVKMELVEKDELIKEIQRNNSEDVLDNAIVSAQGWKAKEKRDKETEQHNQLKLKFLRDAFFYFMIDFHSEEQMKAILAVLSYGDQREDVIHQAYRMRQRGKKFAVKEVSSRGLAFLHEEG